MSISNLFTSNSYNLFCNTLTTNDIILPNDSGVVELSGLSYYSGTGPYTLQRSGINIYYSVHKNLMIFSTKGSTGTFTNTNNNSSYTLGPFDTNTLTPLPFNLPYVLDSSDGNRCNVISVKVNGNYTTATIDFNSNSGGVPGAWDIKVYFNSPDGGTTAGQVLDSDTLNFCGYTVYLPVQPV